MVTELQKNRNKENEILLKGYISKFVRDCKRSITPETDIKQILIQIANNFSPKDLSYITNNEEVPAGVYYTLYSLLKTIYPIKNLNAEVMLQEAYNHNFVTEKDLENSPIKDLIVSGYYNYYNSSFQRLNRKEKIILRAFAYLQTKEEIMKTGEFTDIYDIERLTKFIIRKLRTNTIDEAISKAYYLNIL